MYKNGLAFRSPDEPVPLPLVDDAVPALATGVGQLLADGPLEEALTALAAVHAIMFPWNKRSKHRVSMCDNYRISQISHTFLALRLITRNEISRIRKIYRIFHLSHNKKFCEKFARNAKEERNARIFSHFSHDKFDKCKKARNFSHFSLFSRLSQWN